LLYFILHAQGCDEGVLALRFGLRLDMRREGSDLSQLPREESLLENYSSIFLFF